jgi:hypothetical protein
MSLLSKIGKRLVGAVTGFITGGPQGAVAGALANPTNTGPTLVTGPLANTTASSFGAQLAPIMSVLPGVGSVIAKVGSKVIPYVGTAAAIASAGSLIYDAAGNIIGHRKKRRRMNPMNARAARRAIRRIRAVRKITQQIERSLPKARAPASRRYSGGRPTQYIENVRNS